MKCTIPLTLSRKDRAFSLVELLTVIFIIGLLIAILIPSLSAARNQAKGAVTKKTMSVVGSALEMFKNDNGPDFPQTNGYPPSFSHPPIAGYTFQPELGQFPFLKDHPVVYGAEWLPAMLMGVDQLGYIKRSSVTSKDALNTKPELWYTPDAMGAGQLITDRAPKYLDAENLPLKKTKDLPGKANKDLFPDWDKGNEPPGIKMHDLWVIVDGFEQPILYYAASTHGRPTNMVEDKHVAGNNYGTGAQTNGTPYYFHQDNEGFTGNDTKPGWDFSGNGKPHAIAEVGAAITPRTMVDGSTHTTTFAHYIVDRKMLSTFTPQTPETAPMRPVNAESYLLISAGVDGHFGTSDDLSNLPPFLNP